MSSYETRVRLLSATLALLVLALVLGWVLDPARRTRVAEGGVLLAGKPAEVASLEIRGERPLSLLREGGTWYLLRGEEKLPAQASRVESFLDSLAAVTRLAPVARGKDAWEGYGLSEGEATRILAKDAAGRSLADFRAGRRGSTGRELYARLEGKDASYAVDAGFESWLRYPATGWLDLRILPGLGGAEKVQALAVRGSLALDGPAKPKLTLSWRIAREAGGWKDSGGRELDAVAAESLVRAVINLEGADFAPPGVGLGRVEAVVELELGDGRRALLELGGEAGEGRRLLRAEGAERLFEVPVHALRNMIKPLDELASR